MRYIQWLFENPVVLLPSYWQSTYWFYGLWQLYNRIYYVRCNRPILSLLLGLLAIEVGLPLTLSSPAFTYSCVAATPRNIDRIHFQRVRSVLWSHCCEFFVKCVRVWRYQNHIFAFFLIRTILRSQFWRVIWVFNGWCFFGPESYCRENALSSCAIHIFRPNIISLFLMNILC
jgi:hypothetical protein